MLSSSLVIRGYLAAVFLLVFPTTLGAGTIFFSGDLRTDTTVLGCGSPCVLNAANSDTDYAQWAAAVYSFNVANTTTMQAITYGYAGGTSNTGIVVPSGGLEPYLSLFDAAGDFLASSFGSGCPPGGNTVAGNCYDVSLDGGTLAPGTYQIAISAYENMSFAENDGPPLTLADGFTGLGNLGLGENLSYGFDVILPTSVSAPEPGTFGIAFLSVGLLAGIWKTSHKGSKL